MEIEAVEMQGPGAGHFTIGEHDVDSDDDVDSDEDGRGISGGDVQGVGGDDGNNTSGKVYSLADFEPQRHTDLT